MSLLRIIRLFMTLKNIYPTKLTLILEISMIIMKLICYKDI